MVIKGNGWDPRWEHEPGKDDEDVENFTARAKWFADRNQRGLLEMERRDRLAAEEKKSRDERRKLEAPLIARATAKYAAIAEAERLRLRKKKRDEYLMYIAVAFITAMIIYSVWSSLTKP